MMPMPRLVLVALALYATYDAYIHTHMIKHIRTHTQECMET